MYTGRIYSEFCGFLQKTIYSCENLKCGLNYQNQNPFPWGKYWNILQISSCGTWLVRHVNIRPRELRTWDCIVVIKRDHFEKSCLNFTTLEKSSKFFEQYQRKVVDSLFFVIIASLTIFSVIRVEYISGLKFTKIASFSLKISRL